MMPFVFCCVVMALAAAFCVVWAVHEEKKARQRVEEIRLIFREQTAAAHQTISTLQVALGHLMTKDDPPLRNKIIRSQRPAIPAEGDEEAARFQKPLAGGVHGRYQRYIASAARDTQAWKGFLPEDDRGNS
jgi:hypothetical protein